MKRRVLDPILQLIPTDIVGMKICYFFSRLLFRILDYSVSLYLSLFVRKLPEENKYKNQNQSGIYFCFCFCNDPTAIKKSGLPAYNNMQQKSSNLSLQLELHHKSIVQSVMSSSRHNSINRNCEQLE